MHRRKNCFLKREGAVISAFQMERPSSQIIKNQSINHSIKFYIVPFKARDPSKRLSLCWIKEMIRLTISFWFSQVSLWFLYFLTLFNSFFLPHSLPLFTSSTATVVLSGFTIFYQILTVFVGWIWKRVNFFYLCCCLLILWFILCLIVSFSLPPSLILIPESLPPTPQPTHTPAQRLFFYHKDITKAAELAKMSIAPAPLFIYTCL